MSLTAHILNTFGSKFALLVLVGAALVGGTYYIKESQDARRAASSQTGTVQIQFVPETDPATVKPGDTVSYRLQVATQDTSLVDGFQVMADVTFPEQVNGDVVFRASSLNEFYPLGISTTDISRGKRLTLSYLSKNPDVGGRVRDVKTLGTLVFKAPSTGQVTIAYDRTRSKILQHSTSRDLLQLPVNQQLSFAAPSPTPTASTAPTTTSGGSGVNRVALVQVRSGEVVRELNLNQTNVVMLGTLPEYSLRAFTSSDVKSVKFVNNPDYRPNDLVYTDSQSPFAILGDVRNVFNAWSVGVGTYELTITPYTGPNGNGQALTPVRLTVRIENAGASPVPSPSPTPPAEGITKLSLVQVRTHEVVRELKPNEVNVIKLGSLPEYSLQAFTTSGVKSVKFVNNPDYRTYDLVYTDTQSPFAILGDVQNVFNAWSVGVGTYELTFTPYDANGQALQEMKTTVKIEN